MRRPARAPRATRPRTDALAPAASARASSASGSGHRRNPEFSDSLIYLLSDDLDLASPLLRVGDATVPVDERHRGDLGAALVEPVFVAVRGHLHREASKPA